MAFGDTLQSLATFGASIGTTIVSTARGLKTSSVPATNLPQSSFNVAPPQKTGVNVTEVVVLVLLGLGLAFGIRAVVKK